MYFKLCTATARRAPLHTLHFTLYTGCILLCTLYADRQVRAIVRALFGAASAEDTRAAFAVFDTGGEGSLDANELKVPRAE